MKNLFFSAFIVLSVVLFAAAHLTTAAPQSCGTVAMKAATCVSYATGKVPKPDATCCSGLQALAQTVKSLDDKKAICRCLKAGVKNFAGVQDKFLQQIPGACNIKVGFPVSLTVNCETIH